MALYTEKSLNDLSGLFASEERRRQNLLRQQQEQALQEYNTQKNNLDKKYENDNGGLGGFLGGIVGGIGKGIGDVGKGLFDLFGSAGASVRDLGSYITTGKSAGEAEKFKKWLYDTDDLGDAYAKSAGTALNAATNIATTALPVAGAGGAIGKAASGAVANTAAGALGGVADELQEQGKDASMEGATNRALSGAAAGLATAGLNRKIGNASSNLGSKILNNNVATSTLGRGALSGAVGGSVGAGTSAALAGQDVGSAALQGGLTGAIGGATQAGLVAGASKLGQKVIDSGRKVNNVNTSSTGLDATVDDGMPDYTRPTGWNDNELSIEKNGAVGSLGKKLENTAKAIKDQDVYNSLYSKTAEKVGNNNSIERLRSLGFEPKDYAEAAKVSETTNKFINDVVKNSKATVTDNDFVSRINTPVEGQIIDSPSYQKALKSEISGLVDRLETGKIPGNYDVSKLLDESRRFGDLANTHRTKSVNVNGDIVNTNEAALAAQYSKIRNELRGLANTAMDGFGDNYTKSQLAQRLKNAGANEQTIKYVTDFDDLSGAIRNTALFEDARQMNNEMSKTKYRRNATAGDSTNPLNTVLKKTGASQLLNTVAEPIGRVTGRAAEAIGRGLQKASSFATDIASNGPQMSVGTQNILGNYLGRTTGGQQANDNIQALRRAQDYKNLEDMFGDISSSVPSGAMMGDNIVGGSSAAIVPQNAATSQIMDNLSTISTAMDLALAAGDITSYNQLADLYKSAYNMYQIQTEMSGANSKDTKLSSTQQSVLRDLDTSENTLSQLKEAYQSAGGAQGIAGNLSEFGNFLTGGAVNRDLATYNSLKNSLGSAIIKNVINLGGTEQDAKRYTDMLPSASDSPQQAEQKFAYIEQMLNNARQSVYNNA